VTIGLSILVAVGFIRIVTSARIYPDPTPLSVALAAVERLVKHPRCRMIAPGPYYLDDVTRLCRAVDASRPEVNATSSSQR
jgi:hypothetical protein